ncbi:MAG: replication protein [Nitrospirota bacterium]
MVKPDYMAMLERNSCKGLKPLEKPVNLEANYYSVVIEDATKLVEETYTRFNNNILEALPLAKLKMESIRLYLVLIRKLSGYHNIIDKIAQSQLQKASGLSKRSVLRALDDLIKRNMIVKIKTKDICSYILTPAHKWISGETSTTKIDVIKQIQGDLFEKYYTKKGVCRAADESVSRAGSGVSEETPIGVSRAGDIGVCRAGHKRNKETYTKESEKIGLCKITENGLSNDEIQRHATKHNCLDVGMTCPEECIIWHKIHLINFNKSLASKD